MDLNEQMIAARLDKARETINGAKKMIWVTFQKEGIHQYLAAGTDPALASVSYLANKHRHLFKFKIKIEVEHNDREIEFHMFLAFCQSLLKENVIDIDNKSCEMLADDLYVQISVQYPNRDVIIEVSEDGENGCEIHYYHNMEHMDK